MQRKHVKKHYLIYFCFVFPEDKQIWVLNSLNQQVIGLKAKREKKRKEKAILEVFIPAELECKMEPSTSEHRAMERREVFQKELEEFGVTRCLGS